MNSLPVAISEYDPEWPALFAALAEQIRQALGAVAMRIDHIGSTAIVGLGAKPIVDVQISVETLEPMASYLPSLTSLGYQWRQDNPERTKRYFREPPGRRRTHVHVRRAGSWNEQFALLFRDYLRVSPKECARYERSKRELAQEFREDRAAYVEAKGPVIWEIIARADRWAKEVGWAAGPSDA